MKTIKTLDLEPLWIDLVKMWQNMGVKVQNDKVYPELQKMAIIADTIRQAQKKGETVTITPDGVITTKVTE